MSRGTLRAPKWPTPALCPRASWQRDVPAQKYAVFECTLPTLGETYKYIMEEWQPASGYERADAPDFEVYDDNWAMNDPAGSPMYVYWPIR